MSAADSDTSAATCSECQPPHPSKKDDSEPDSPLPISKEGGIGGEMVGTAPSLTRRNFLQSTAAAGACTLGMNGAGDDGAFNYDLGLFDDEPELPPPITMEDLPTHVPADRPGNFDQPGYISREGYRMMAETERQMQQQTPAVNNLTKVNALDELGIAPGDTISDALNGADLEGKLLLFPKGNYFLDAPPNNKIVLNADQFGIKGPNATFVLNPGVQIQFQFWPEQRGIAEGFTLDMSAKGAFVSTLIKTSGRADYVGVSVVGTIAQSRITDEAGSAIMMRPMPVGGAYVRIVGWSAMGGSNAGSHGWATGRCSPPPGYVAEGNGCPGAYVGGQGAADGAVNGEVGTVDFIGCKLHGWENGLYCSKTEGRRVRVFGGGYVNNNNASIRLGGADSVADGASVLLDQRIYPADKMPGPYKPGEIQGVNCVRIETVGSITTYKNSRSSPLRNLDLRTYKLEKSDVSCTGGLNGVIRIMGDAGSGPIKGCRVESYSPETAIIKANAPRSNTTGKYSRPKPPYGIHISNVDVYGRPHGEPAINIMERPNSSIVDSCIHLKGAGPEEIQGIPSGNIRNVGYGKNCDKSQGTQGPVGAINASQLRNYSSGLNVSGNYSYPYNGSYPVGGGGGGGFGIASKVAAFISSIAMMAFFIVLGGFLLLGMAAGIAFAFIYYLSKYVDDI